MAGSYDHIVDDEGRLRSSRSFTQMIENLGDAYEMAEEMYGMIWFLAQGDSRKVSEAQAAYRVGITVHAPGAQKAQP